MGLSPHCILSLTRWAFSCLALPLALGATEPVVEFLAAPGPTSGPWSHLGKPWVSWDESRHLLLAFMVPGKEAQDLRVRRFTLDEGWGPEETVLAGMQETPWLWARWYPVGPGLSWCEQNGPEGHHHPFLLWEQDQWQRAREIPAPDYTRATGREFPKGRTPYLEHVVQDPKEPDLWRIVRVEAPEGGASRETFHFQIIGDRTEIRTWERVDGTCWCAAVVPGERAGACRIEVERLDRSGHRFRKTLAEVGAGTANLFAWGSDQGRAAVAWAAGSPSQLHVRLRGNHRWHPEVNLGEITQTGEDLGDDLSATTPDAQGRVALAWIRGGELLSTDFHPARGWSRPRVLAQDAERADWTMNQKGERLLYWSQQNNGSTLFVRRWSPASGWAPIRAIRIPEGRLPECFLFNDGTEMAVGLASAEGGCGWVRPWSMRLH